MMETRLRPFRDGIAAAVLLLLTVSLYWKVTRLWWTYDDVNTIHTIVDHRWVDSFIAGEIWPQKLFTPLLMLAFELQERLFGLDAARWYGVQLALVYLAVLAVYAALRLFFEWGPALSGAALFAAGPAVCSIVAQLSTIHYMIAIALGALGVATFVAAVRRSNPLLNALSALLYLGAMLAKEIAVPMPLLLVFLPAGDRKTRRRYAIAHLGALAIYFAWRRAVLGTWLGSYGWVVQSDEWARLLILLPWRVVTAAAGSNLVIGLGLIGIMAVVAAAGVRSRGVLPLVLAGLLVAIAPLVPVAREVNRRYVVVPWLAASILFAAGARALGGRRSAILLTAVPLAAVIANREEWADEYRVRRQMSEEARFFTEMPPNGMLRAPLTPPAAMQELNWLKVVRLRRPAGAAWFYDDYYLCVKDPAGRRMWQYDGAVKSMIEITNNAPAIARRHCRSIRDGVPLSARFRYEQPAALYWSLGPYDDGTYTVLLGNGVQSFRVNRNDALNVPASALALRIRYDSPQGWTTYSPELTLDLSKNMETAWQR